MKKTDEQKELLKQVACDLIDKLPNNPLGGYKPRRMEIHISLVGGIHQGLEIGYWFPSIKKEIDEKDYAMIAAIVDEKLSKPGNA